MSKILFEGKGQPLGGITNEQELVKKCPKEFRDDYHNNQWCEAAQLIFFKGGQIKHWKWKSKDPKEISKQMECFKGVISGWGLQHEDKTAVAGWMLSEMLEEVPVHIPVEKKEEMTCIRE